VCWVSNNSEIGPVFMSMVIYFALGVLMGLLMRSLTVDRLAVGVPGLPGYCTLLPPATIFGQFGSSFFSDIMRQVMRP
jgi:hypothetical protein